MVFTTVHPTSKMNLKLTCQIDLHIYIRHVDDAQYIYILWFFRNAKEQRRSIVLTAVTCTIYQSSRTNSTCNLTTWVTQSCDAKDIQWRSIDCRGACVIRSCCSFKLKCNAWSMTSFVGTRSGTICLQRGSTSQVECQYLTMLNHFFPGYKTRSLLILSPSKEEARVW